MDMRSYENWREHSADESSVEEVTWNKNDLLTLPWEATYMTDEIPEDSSQDTFATKNKKALESVQKSVQAKLPLGQGVDQMKKNSDNYYKAQEALNKKTDSDNKRNRDADVLP